LDDSEGAVPEVELDEDDVVVLVGSGGGVVEVRCLDLCRELLDRPRPDEPKLSFFQASSSFLAEPFGVLVLVLRLDESEGAV
jgi:hypothetical protein